jgi:hypothetical protein
MPHYYEAGLFGVETMFRLQEDGLADRDPFAKASTVNREKQLNLKGPKQNVSDLIPCDRT